MQTEPTKGGGNERRALAPSPALVLVIVTALWGLSFPLIKNWQDAAHECPGGAVLATLTLIALRMVLALLVLAVIRPRLILGPSRREHAIGTLIGSVCFLGFTLQVRGLASTTPALSGFITSLGSAWVPLLAWVWWRMVPARLTLLGIALGVVGTVVLGLTDLSKESRGAGWMWLAAKIWGGGEGLTLLASGLFAIEILLLDRLGRTVQPAHLTVPFLGSIGVWALLVAILLAAGDRGLGPWLAWSTAMLRNGAIVRDLIVLTLFSTVLAFHWMNVYQPRVSASRAALIYLLEPVFSAVFSVLGGYEEVTLPLLIGGGLILGGNCLVELPVWLRLRSLPTEPA